ncbi:hypothetical protein [Variovorax sp. JS1663]|uniref:hypothetical protein n=1 Tax=Variovorax sp. JS1663 TaxID=1851577 RepID=UPI000B6471C6|nr:hypothetical protein [Variovorax sp. JS1663]OUM01657.1 hypothetical protein A8M77_15400 [Variovorax sp. JS1663]
MPNQFHPDDVEAVLSAMAAFEARCEEIMTLLGEKRWLPPAEREAVEELYRSLKNDLKTAAKAPFVHQPTRNRALTVCESAFYDPAVRKAAIALRPATNSNPIGSHWYSAVHEAQMEFSYYRHSLKRALELD